MMKTITLERLKSLVVYEPKTGIFTWRTRRQRVAPGRVAGHKNLRGYIVIGVGGGHYLGHRLAWFYHYGRWPKMGLDHINRVGNENWIDNLREATQSQNQWNRRISRNNRSGTKGVCRFRDKWRAQITVRNKRIYLGVYAEKAKAVAARRKAELEFHPFTTGKAA